MQNKITCKRCKESSKHYIKNLCRRCYKYLHAINNIKLCKSCNEIRIYKAKGLCKKCYSKKYRIENKEKDKKYRKEYNQNNPNYTRNYYLKNKDKWEEHSRNPIIKKRKSISDKKYIRKNQNNPVFMKKVKARHIAKFKIKIPKDKICEYCKKRKATQRHHKDYNKPLEVKFLCATCNNPYNEKKKGI